MSSERGEYTVPRNGDDAPCKGAGGDDMGSVAEKDKDFPENGCLSSLSYSSSFSSSAG